MNINTELFLQSLGLMGKGMLGIFIVTGVIVLFIVAFGKISAKADAKRAAKNPENEEE